MKPISSETTTPLTEPDSSLGTPHGAHGLATPADLARRLAAKPVERIEAELASRASSLGVVLRIEDDFSPTAGLVVKAVTASGSRSCLTAALEAYRKAMTPAPRAMIEDWLAELSVIAPARADDAMTVALRIRAYVDRLAAFPADVCREVLLILRWRWWPSWFELAEAADKLTRRRAAIIRALEAALRRTPDQMTGRERPTSEQRRDIANRILSESFGESWSRQAPG